MKKYFQICGDILINTGIEPWEKAQFSGVSFMDCNLDSTIINRLLALLELTNADNSIKAINIDIENPYYETHYGGSSVDNKKLKLSEKETGYQMSIRTVELKRALRSARENKVQNSFNFEIEDFITELMKICIKKMKGDR